MRASPFAILVILLVVVGLAALFEHRPGPGPAETVESLTRQPTGNLGSQQQPAAAVHNSGRRPATSRSGDAGHSDRRSQWRASQDARKNAPRIPAPAPMAGMTQHAAMQETSSAGDPIVGQKVFRKCGACHSLEPGRNMIGPSLGGIIGRKAGTEPDFTYSSAMKQANITWTPPTLAT